ncbi:hypothetical protein E3N88_40323 [Mikania micrantha]|uniref:Uncharacterized protein n=1 Tax=Mikania micrantha TaxID=192012 RepID=A0A5N6LMC1_9ASTR|nr:hypothetical protein E3N88_40323 [Mikania micrantha]
MSNDLRPCIDIWPYVTGMVAPPPPPHVIVSDDEEPIAPVFQDHEEGPEEDPAVRLTPNSPVGAMRPESSLYYQFGDTLLPIIIRLNSIMELKVLIFELYLVNPCVAEQKTLIVLLVDTPFAGRIASPLV